MDVQTRDLQRRWQQTNDPQDEAAYLKERSRSGDLTFESIQIAAYAGYPAACLLDSETRPLVAADENIQYWIFGLQIWGKDVLVEAARSAAVTTLRAAKTIEGLEERLTAHQLRLLGCMVDATKRWKTYTTAISELSGQIYTEIYEADKSSNDKDLLLIASAFTWLGYTACWNFSPMGVIPKNGVQNSVYGAIQTGLAASGMAPKMALKNLKRDLVSWALGRPSCGSWGPMGDSWGCPWER